MAHKALYVGGCTATYHQMEPSVPSVRAVLDGLGIPMDATGILHPGGGESWTGDYAALTKDNLAKYDLLVLYTTGHDKHGEDTSAIIDFVRSGGALVAIHNGADSFNYDPAYIALIGGNFRTHPAQLDIALEYVDTAHPITKGLKPFTVLDELYLFQNYDPSRVHLLAQTRSYDDNGPVPVCWTREEGVGRVFYLSLGHNAETQENAQWRELFARGVQWTLKKL
jgi:uncharacterized protein